MNCDFYECDYNKSGVCTNKNVSIDHFGHCAYEYFKYQYGIYNVKSTRFSYLLKNPESARFEFFGNRYNAEKKIIYLRKDQDERSEKIIRKLLLIDTQNPDEWTIVYPEDQ